MPVTFDSSATAAVAVAGSSTTGTVSAAHRVSPSAPDLYAVVAVYWYGTVNPAGATFTVTFGGNAMTAVTDGQATAGGGEETVTLYYLANPPTGTQTVTASFTGMGTETNVRLLGIASVTYFGVATIGTGNTNSGASAALNVPSATDQMVFNAFGCYGSSVFTGYNQTSRSSIAQSPGVNLPMLIGDADGDTVVDFTATTPVDASFWGGIGVALLGPAVAYDATGAGTAARSTTLSYSHTVGASASAVVVAVETLIPPNSSVSVTIGSTAMTQLGVLLFGSNNGQYTYLYLFGTLTPPTGAQTVHVTLGSRGYTTVNSVSYTGVSGFGAVVTSTAQSNTVTVASTKPCDRVIAAHGVVAIPGNVFSYNQVKRAIVNSPYGGNILLLGDAPGASTVESTADMSAASNLWASVAVNMTAAPVMLNCSALIGPIVTSARLADYRVQPPSPLRTWTIPAGQGQVVTTPFGIGQEWTQAYDAVLDYTLDFTQWLATTGDSIASVTFTPSDPAITVVSTNADSGIATGWLTGGLNGNAYAIKVHIVTEFGRQDDRTFLLNIDQT